MRLRARLMNIRWRLGFFRLWIVGCLFWLSVVALINWPAPPFDPSTARMVPAGAAPPRPATVAECLRYPTQAEVDACLAGSNHNIFDQFDTPAATASSDHPFVLPSEVPPDTAHNIKRVAWILVESLWVPLLVLALGIAFAWIIRGFTGRESV